VTSLSFRWAEMPPKYDDATRESAVDFLATGLSPSAIARLLKVSRGYVYNVEANLAAFGTASPAPESVIGRPRKIYTENHSLGCD
jgi:transposase